MVDRSGSIKTPVTIGCTLSSVFETVKTGDPIGFGEGILGGVIETVERDALHVRITHASRSAWLERDMRIDLTNRWSLYAWSPVEFTQPSLAQPNRASILSCPLLTFVALSGFLRGLMNDLEEICAWLLRSKRLYVVRTGW